MTELTVELVQYFKYLELGRKSVLLRHHIVTVTMNQMMRFGPMITVVVGSEAL